MKIEQFQWQNHIGWLPPNFGEQDPLKQIVFVFGSTDTIRNQDRIQEVRSKYPKAIFFGCSTAGEIHGTGVFDHSLSITAVQFEKSRIQSASITIKDSNESYAAGKYLADALDKHDLRHVFVLSEGLNVNGSELSKGISENLPEDVKLTGGLSGDAAKFEETFVLIHEKPERNLISVIGFYGADLKIGFGSVGGWDPFGPERKITKSINNVLYELDGEPVLDLYKKYLGEHAKDLPGSGLLFPLSLRKDQEKTKVVRTILGMNEKDGSLTFAGDMPEGDYASLMKANFDRLIDGAESAANYTKLVSKEESPEFAILISCVGRKLVLDQRIEEEVEAVRNVLGDKTVFTGFYSFGEICPFTPEAKCDLHNQTMTITSFSEN